MPKKTSLRTLCHVAVLCLCWLYPMMGRSFEVKEKSLEEKVAASSLVLFGTILDTDADGFGSYTHLGTSGGQRVALVRVDKVLKGSAGDTVRLVYARGIAESDLACCRVGAHYLFFLEANSLGMLESVNGRFGAYRTDNFSSAYP